MASDPFLLFIVGKMHVLHASMMTVDLLQSVDDFTQWEWGFVSADKSGWWEDKFTAQVFFSESIEFELQFTGDCVVQISTVDTKRIQIGNVVTASLIEKNVFKNNWAAKNKKYYINKLTW